MGNFVPKLNKVTDNNSSWKDGVFSDNFRALNWERVSIRVKLRVPRGIFIWARSVRDFILVSSYTEEIKVYISKFLGYGVKLLNGMVWFDLEHLFCFNLTNFKFQRTFPGVRLIDNKLVFFQQKVDRDLYYILTSLLQWFPCV